jgi:hypothetical protein
VQNCKDTTDTQKHKTHASKYSTQQNTQAAHFIPKTLNTDIAQFITASASLATWRKHASAFNCLKAFETHTQHKCTFPLDESTVCSFVAYSLSTRNLKHTTVRSYLSSLVFYHKLRKMDSSNCSSFLVECMLRGAKNLDFYKSLAKNTRKVMTYPLLKILSHQIAIAGGPVEEKQLYWTAMVVAFFGSFRFGELLSKTETKFNENETLLWENVVFSKDSVTIHVKIPKNKKEQGEYIDIFTLPDGRYCPVRALRKLKSTHCKSEKDPVFTTLHDTYLTPSIMTEKLRQLLRPTLGEEAMHYSGHSFRAGLPSALASCPDIASEEDIRSWGRWGGDSFKAYTRLKYRQKKIIFQKIVSAINIKY